MNHLLDFLFKYFLYFIFKNQFFLIYLIFYKFTMFFYLITLKNTTFNHYQKIINYKTYN